MLFEGKPVGTPDPGAFWRVISEHKVTVLFTAPTAFRAIKKEDPDGTYLEKYDTSCLRSLFLAGERLDPDTLVWAEDKLKVPLSIIGGRPRRLDLFELLGNRTVARQTGFTNASGPGLAARCAGRNRELSQSG